MSGRMTRQVMVAGFVGVFVLGPITGALASTRALWHMNDSNATNNMVDSSSYNNDGERHNVVVGQPPVYGGTSFYFNGSNSYVTVPDTDNSLDPFSANITVTAWVRFTGPILDDSYDIVRKGLGSTAGGDWKMEIKNIKRLGTVGKLKCTFRGHTEVVKTASPDIMDGRDHELECTKTASSVIARVDGRSYTKSVAAGSIANTSNTMLGAKIPGDDVYNGYMDEVSVNIGG